MAQSAGKETGAGERARRGKRMTKAERQQQQTAGIFALIRDVLSDKSVDGIAYEDKHVSIQVTRNTADKTTFAISFGADIDEADEEESEENENSEE